MSNAARVLIADTDVAAASRLRAELTEAGVAVTVVPNTESVHAALEQRPHAVVILDRSVAGGAAAVRDVCEGWPGTLVLVTGDSVDLPSATEAMRAGASDVLEKPVATASVVRALEIALSATEHATEAPRAAASGDVLGNSVPIQKLRDQIARSAAGTVTILLRGESGTGKELAARAVHEASPRRAAPFIKVHCAALPESLLESELFGYEKGAFTGATQRKPGRVHLAESGTLFLDEIGDISPATQVKLLRLLQDRDFEPLGGTQTLHADVRFVAATHRDLEGMVKRGEFREDLYYRLNVVTIWLPPLRARRGDISVLARRFCEAFGRESGAQVRLTDEAVRHLEAQRWPGNVRQLENLIERAVVLRRGPELGVDDIKRELIGSAQFVTQATDGTISRLTSSQHSPGERVVPLSEEVRAAERRALVRALEHTKGNRTLAAKLLGVSRATLYNKLDEHGLS